MYFSLGRTLEAAFSAATGWPVVVIDMPDGTAGE